MFMIFFQRYDNICNHLSQVLCYVFFLRYPEFNSQNNSRHNKCHLDFVVKEIEAHGSRISG